MLDLPEKEEQKQELTIQAVKRWLQRQHGWLLILDNADAHSLLHTLLPQTVSGHVLITTRAADLSAYIAGLPHSLEIESFSDKQGALFLLHRANLLAPDATLDQAETQMSQAAMEVAHELGGLPLALDQAGAYLNATSSSLTAYQQIYQQRRTQLLGNRRGADHLESVATTWSISFRQIERENPVAADLLCLCAFLAPDAIPEELITQKAKELGPTLEPIGDDPYLLNEAVESLRTYSLITRDRQTQTLTVHRLVQAVLRDSMDTQIQEQWMQRVILAVNAAFPLIELEDWLLCERLLPHALTCTAWMKQVPTLETHTAARLLHQVGYYLNERGRFAKAEAFYLRSQAIYEQLLGAEHPNVAVNLGNRAVLYQQQGKYKEAELLCQRALVILQERLGPTHPYTIKSLNNLAGVYRALEKYREAEPLLERVLFLRQSQLGMVHSETALSQNNLAELYQTQGRYKEAESLYQSALSIYRKLQRIEHPDSALAMQNLAVLYHDQRIYEKAEPLLEHALAIYEHTSGAMHNAITLQLSQMQGQHALRDIWNQPSEFAKTFCALE